MADGARKGSPPDLTAPDGYELIRPIGEGGCGVVWLARERAGGGAVALKFLLNARPVDVERFRREATFTARLNDPAIVRIREWGETAGRAWIAMQYIDGGSLVGARFTTGDLTRAIRVIALALRHAHAQGIVHRDVKPQNILLDRRGEVYVSDFGIARELRWADDATVTLQGAVFGTPAFMSPEQARGDPRAIDGRSDIYSLGATLFYKLTGRPPFDAGTIVETLHGVIHDPPPMPRSIDPSVPPSLEAIALKCMQKDRRERYQTMDDLVADLDSCLAGRPVESERSYWFRRLVGAPEGADTPSDPAASDPDVALVLEIAREIAGWDANLYRVSSNLPRIYPQLDALIGRLEEVLVSRPDFAMARFYRGVALFRRGLLDAALDDMERAIDRIGDLAGAHFELGRLYLAIFLRGHDQARTHLSRVGMEEQISDVRGRLGQALVAFKEAQRIKGDLPLWQMDFVRAVERLADNDPDGCVAVCDGILARDADLEEVWKLRGDALRMAGMDPLDSYDRAIGIRRSYCDAILAKAQAQLDAGDAGASRESLARAIEVRPDCAEAHVLLARSFLPAEGQTGVTKTQAGLPQEVWAHVDRALALDPTSFEATVTSATLKIEAGRHPGGAWLLDAALETLERARHLDGCQNRVGLLMARARLERIRQVLATGGGAQEEASSGRPSVGGVSMDPRTLSQAREDIEEIHRLFSHSSAHTPDNERWRDLLEAVRIETERFGS